MTYLERLNKLIAQGEYLLKKNFRKNIPELTGWNSAIIRFVGRLFGEGSRDVERLKNRRYGYEDYSEQSSYKRTKKQFVKNMAITIEELKSMRDDAIEKDNEKTRIRIKRVIKHALEKIPYVTLILKLYKKEITFLQLVNELNLK